MIRQDDIASMECAGSGSMPGPGPGPELLGRGGKGGGRGAALGRGPARVRRARPMKDILPYSMERRILFVE